MRCGYIKAVPVYLNVHMTFFNIAYSHKSGIVGGKARLFFPIAKSFEKFSKTLAIAKNLFYNVKGTKQS